MRRARSITAPAYAGGRHHDAIVRSLQTGLLGPVRASRPKTKVCAPGKTPSQFHDRAAVEVIVGASSCHSPEHDAEPHFIISTANAIEPISTRYHKTVRGPLLTMSKPCRNTCIW